MVKKQVNNKSTKSKTEEIKTKIVEEEQEIKEFDNDSIPDDSSSEEESEEVPSKNGNKKSRYNAVEKNIEALESMDRNTGVIYLGHLPWGFDDVGIKKYFEQFGKITRILVPRSKRTGRTKGYGFVEFEDKEVAEIAAKTMNNYILFDKVLKCSVVEDTSKHNLIFKKWKRKFKYHDKYQNYVQEKNKLKSKEEVKDNIKLLLEKEETKRKKLAELGIKYDFPGFTAIIEKHKPSVESKKKTKLIAEPKKSKETKNEKNEKIEKEIKQEEKPSTTKQAPVNKKNKTKTK